MSWKHLAQYDWAEPLEIAARLPKDADMALLYSGRREQYTGRISYLAVEAIAHAQGHAWQALPASDDACGALPDWIGYLGYGMRLDADIGYTPQAASPIALPDFWLTRHQRLFVFDHEAQRLDEYGRAEAAAPAMLMDAQEDILPSVQQLRSSMTRDDYERAVAATVRGIESGDFYQANITRKFDGTFTHAPDALTLFAKLCMVSPAPYSALLRHGARAILSSSPECFLTVDAHGRITTRPIKGSIRRGINDAEDTALKKALAASGKNLAENLMIVDLMRNDLAQVSEVGSVAVAEQSGLYSYATIHHLISTVVAQKLPECSAYNVVRACFPPGSMTGAPKRAAVQWCETQEPQERGVYSGAIGWFGAQHQCDLSVVIRTLVIDGAAFEFQVGGGIVADSTPEDEWRETLVKARGIAAALGITEAQLEVL